MAQLLSNKVWKEIERFLGTGIDIREFNTLSEIYGIISAHPEGISISALAQKYKLLPVDAVHAIATMLNKVGVVSIEYKKTIGESVVKIVKKEAVKETRKVQPEAVRTETDPEVKTGIPLVINKIQMEKAQKLLLLTNGVTLAELLKDIGLQQNPQSIKILLGRLKGRFKLVIGGDPEDPENCVLKIER